MSEGDILFNIHKYVLSSYDEKIIETMYVDFAQCNNLAMQNSANSSSTGCNYNFRIACWPPTEAGETASIRCSNMSLQGDHHSDGSGLRQYHLEHAEDVIVTRMCLANGTWGPVDSSDCEFDAYNSGLETNIKTLIFCMGNAASIVNLTIALRIFAFFRKLWCLRSAIHVNLMLSILIADFTYFARIALQGLDDTDPTKNNAFGAVLVIDQYFFLSTFWWTLAECMYLFINIAFVFRAVNLRLSYFVVIGWVIPFFAVLVATLYAHATKRDKDFYKRSVDADITKIYDIPKGLSMWGALMITIYVVSVLIRKRRDMNSQEKGQFWRSVKAIVVLLPLMMLQYVMFLVILMKRFYKDYPIVLAYIASMIIALKGYFVALIFCFLNKEVVAVVLLRIKVYKYTRDIGNPSYQLTSNEITKGEKESPGDAEPVVETDAIDDSEKDEIKTAVESLQKSSMQSRSYLG